LPHEKESLGAPLRSHTRDSYRARQCIARFCRQRATGKGDRGAHRWRRDADPEVASIVTSKASDADANDRLKRDALQALASKLSLLQKAKSVTVRVIYDKVGAVSPTYGSLTFSGVERYANLTMSIADAKTNRDRWKDAASSQQPLPAWINFAVVGELPQR
jgi:hypothetical protein